MTWYYFVILLVLLLVALSLFIIVRNRKPKTIATSYETSLFTTIFGYKIRFHIQGAGHPVLLLHGIGASSYVWRFILPFLSAHYKTITLDLLGFGMSDKPREFNYDLDSQCEIIIEFLNQHKVDKAYLVGSSMGGTIALRLGQLYPTRFEKLALIAPAADPKISVFDIDKFSFLSPFVSPIIGETFVKQIMKRVMNDRSKISEESIAMYSMPYSQKEAIESFIKSFSLLRDKRVLQELPNVQQPTLVLWGKKDKIIPIKHSQTLLSKMPQAKFKVHETAGHHPQEDEPEWVIRQIHGHFSS